MQKQRNERRNRKWNMKKHLFAALLIGALMWCMLFSGYTAHAATGDVGEPTVTVSNFPELQDAMQSASDGDIIGIDNVMEIKNNISTLGYKDKHINIIRMSNDAYFEVNQSGTLTVRNMTFDGNRDNFRVSSYQPMFAVKSNANFKGVLIQNCKASTWGGAIQVWQNTVANIDNCIFKNNRSAQGGHVCLIEYATVNISNSILENGDAGGADGGAISNADITATLNVSSCVLHGNVADCGGGIHNRGTTVLRNTVIYGNRANFGADIANQVTSHFQIESLEQLIPVYKAHGVLPKQWVNDMDYSKMTPNLIEPSEENSLMKLVYDVIDIPVKPTETETEQTETESIEKETEAEKQPESESESETKKESETKTETETETESEKSPESDFESETEPKQTETEQTETGTETESEKQPEVETETKTETETEAKPTESEKETEVKSEPQSEPKETIPSQATGTSTEQQSTESNVQGSGVTSPAVSKQPETEQEYTSTSVNKGDTNLTGKVRINGKTYLYINGVKFTGTKGKYYYRNGLKYTGWQKKGKKKFYFSKGIKIKNKFKTIKGKKYYFNKKGIMAKGLTKIKGKYYYFSKSGVMQKNRWVKIGKYRYYFNKKGVRVKRRKV